MAVSFTLQNASRACTIPKPSLLKKWVIFTFETEKQNADICLRVVGKKESERLNAQYRHQRKPTNVLSFCYTAKENKNSRFIFGDIVVCAPIVREEAISYGIPILNHWAHMVVHGCLHLMGDDHQNGRETKIMESKENHILKALGPFDVRRSPFSVKKNSHVERF